MPSAIEPAEGRRPRWRRRGPRRPQRGPLRALWRPRGSSFHWKLRGGVQLQHGWLIKIESRPSLAVLLVLVVVLQPPLLTHFLQLLLLQLPLSQLVLLHGL